MDIHERNLVRKFFNHKIEVAVTTREEYDSLFDLLRRLKPGITWRDGDDLYSYDGFQECREKTYIAYDEVTHGVMYGDIAYADEEKIMSYDEFETLVNGKCLSFEEILFGKEGG